MKNKGFTLVELITTFALTAVIIIILINVVVAIKEVYSNTSIKTELYINQSNLSNVLNSKIKNGNIESYSSCDPAITDSLMCYDFYFVDGQSERLIVKEKQIIFGKYTYNLDDKSSVDSVNVVLPDVYGRFLHIKIPIKNELYPDIDFGVNLVYLY